MSLRIARLDLVPWGCFADHSLEFALAPGIVELIDGPNAAGKSTMSRAELALLYGIPQRTVDAHTHEYTDLRVGAKLIIDGEQLEVVRRKATAGSLRGPDGAVLATDPLPAALGGLTKDVYTGLFQVDHDTLVRGGEELLQGKGEVGASLFAAAAGIATLHDRLADFDDRAGQIFRQRAGSTSLLRELATLRVAERQLKQALIRPSTHRAMERELRIAVARCEELSGQIRDIEAQIAEIERQVRMAPVFVEHRELSRRLSDLGEVPRLAADAEQRRLAAEATLRAAGAQRDRQRKELDRLQGALDAVKVDASLLGRAAEIRVACEQVPVVAKAAGDRRKLEAQLQSARSGLEAAAATVGVAPAELAGMRRADAAHRALDVAVIEHGRLRERRRAAQARVQTAEQRHTEARGAVGAADGSHERDVAALEAAVRTARQRLGLPDQLAETRRRGRRLDEEADRALRRLSPAPATLDALLALPTVVASVVAELRTRADRLADDRRELAGDRRRWEDETVDVRGRREQLQRQGDVATPERLANARRERDHRWSELRAAVDAGHAPEAGIPDRFELAVRAADQIADALTSDAAGAALAVAVEGDEARLVARAEALERRDVALVAEAEAIARDWAKAWAVTGLDIIELAAADAWNADRAVVEAAAREASDAAGAVDALDARLTAAVHVVHARLAEHVLALPNDASLPELVEMADRLIGQQREHAAHASALAKAVVDAERELGVARRDLKAVEGEWKRWTSDWPDRCEHAGLPAGAQPERAQELIRAIKEGLGHVDQIATLESRTAGIDRDSEALRAHIARLCSDVAPDLADRDPAQAAATLNDRLADHERRRDQRESLAERIEEAEAAIADADSDTQVASAELAELCSAAGCQTAEELADIEERSREATALRKERAVMERRIVELGHGAFADLTTRGADFDVAAANQRATELRDTVDELTAERDETKERIGQAKAELDAAERDTSAVAAAENVEFGQARILVLAREYAIARLSAAVLRRAIERYRDRHQDPLVRRANELFGKFTEGTYAELFVDADEKGQGYLVARRNDRVIHEMHQMSKGTREQLFLALRIAAIERYVAMSGPVPVIFDDVFVESDDARCGEIFQALGELAAKTQVIVLTHHHHLVDIAHKTLGNRLRVQELPSAKVVLRAAA